MAKAKMPALFEKSPKDKEKKGVKEGGRIDKMMDAKQMRAPKVKKAKSLKI